MMAGSPAPTPTIVPDTNVRAIAYAALDDVPASDRPNAHKIDGAWYLLDEQLLGLVNAQRSATARGQPIAPATAAAPVAAPDPGVHASASRPRWMTLAIAAAAVLVLWWFVGRKR